MLRIQNSLQNRNRFAKGLNSPPVVNTSTASPNASSSDGVKPPISPISLVFPLFPVYAVSSLIPVLSISLLYVYSSPLYPVGSLLLFPVGSVCSSLSSSFYVFNNNFISNSTTKPLNFFSQSNDSSLQRIPLFDSKSIYEFATAHIKKPLKSGIRVNKQSLQDSQPNKRPKKDQYIQYYDPIISSTDCTINTSILDSSKYPNRIVKSAKKNSLPSYPLFKDSSFLKNVYQETSDSNESKKNKVLTSPYPLPFIFGNNPNPLSSIFQFGREPTTNYKRTPSQSPETDSSNKDDSDFNDSDVSSNTDNDISVASSHSSSSPSDYSSDEDSIPKRKKQKIDHQDFKHAWCNIDKFSNTLLKKLRPVGRRKFNWLVGSRCFGSHFESIFSKENCPYCIAILYRRETSAICCLHGKVVLDKRFLPDDIKDLYEDVSPESKYFINHSIPYNSEFAMASIGVNFDKNLATRKQGAYCLKVQGSINHIIGTLKPEDENTIAKYSQVYLLTPDQQIQLRTSIQNNPLHASIITKMTHSLSIHNSLVKMYNNIRNMTEFNGNDNINVRITPRPSNITSGIRQEINIEQVTGIIPSNFTGSSKEIIFSKKAENGTSSLQNISESNPICDPLLYPIVNPCGNMEWYQNYPVFCQKRKRFLSVAPVIGERTMKRNLTASYPNIVIKVKKRTTVSYQRYHAYKLVERPKSEGTQHLFKLKNLLHLWCVDHFIQNEALKLKYINEHQGEIRTASYIDLDEKHKKSEKSGIHGKVLPKSFKNSKKNQSKKLQNAHSIIKNKGLPTLFITIGLNTAWQELKDAVNRYFEPQYRPEVMARVFKCKLQDIIDDITKEYKFGKPEGWFYSIEFQNKGLPHCHLVVILNENDVPKTVADYDDIVCCEIPCSETQKELFDQVKSNHIHRKCGKGYDMSAPCLKNGVCSQGFPFALQEETDISNKLKPIHRRRENDRTIVIDGVSYNNQWIENYNPFMLQKFRTPFFIVITPSMKTLEYMFKSLYGEPKSTEFKFSRGSGKDEIKEMKDGRTVCAIEACFGLFGFKTSKFSTSVKFLPIHLEKKENVTMSSKKPLGTILGERSTSELVGFIEFCRMNKDIAQFFTYFNVSQYAKWDAKFKVWIMRKKPKLDAISDVYNSLTLSGELYYLRLLLNVVCCPTSFNTYKETNINGNFVLHDTYEEACIVRGLVDSSENIKLSLQFTKMTNSGEQLRNVFAYHMTYNKPTRLSELWTMCCPMIYQDITNLHTDVEVKIALTLEYIEGLLRLHDKSLNNFTGLPLLNINLLANPIRNYLIHQETTHNSEYIDKKLQLIPGLNHKQRTIYEDVIKKVQNKQQLKYFIDGPGGSGKTHLFSIITSKLRKMGHIVLNVASSGAAASQMDGGRTAHSLLKIPITLDMNSMCNIDHDSELAELLRKTSLLIFDEITLANKLTIETIDRTLRDIRVSPELFGGLSIIFAGDFRQLLPVIPNASRTEIVNSCIKKSIIWRQLEIYTLEINERMKNPNDIMYLEYVLSIGNNKCPGIVVGDEYYVKMLEETSIPGNDIKQLAKFIYNDKNNETTFDYYKKRAILCPSNECVKKVNDYIFQMNTNESTTFFSTNKSIESGIDDNVFIRDYNLESIESVGLANHKLELKLDCVVMILHNINTNIGLCNGARALVVGIYPEMVIIQLLGGKFAGTCHCIIPLELTTKNSNLPFTLQRRQFPLTLAYAMTIHKSQGQSIERLGIWIYYQLDSHGQLYVALSRATDASQVRLILPPYEKPNLWVKNVVYDEVLL